MSTRSQIEFVYECTDKEDKKYSESRTVYRHSDGYPEGVIPDLKEFLQWNDGRNEDVEYVAANFLYWSKRKYEERYFKPGDSMSGGRKKWSDFGPTNCSGLHTGFGVCNNKELHGDIEYFYRVIVSEKKGITIECYSVIGFDSTYESVIAIKPKITKVKITPLKKED